MQAAPAARPGQVAAALPRRLRLHVSNAGATRPRQHAGHAGLLALSLSYGQLPGRASPCACCTTAAQPDQPQRAPTAPASAAAGPSPANGLAWHLPSLLPAAAALAATAPLGTRAGTRLERRRQPERQGALAAGGHSCGGSSCGRRPGGAAAVRHARGAGFHLEPAGPLTSCQPCRLTSGVRECSRAIPAAAAALAAGRGAFQPCL